MKIGKPKGQFKKYRFTVKVLLSDLSSYYDI